MSQGVLVMVVLMAALGGLATLYCAACAVRNFHQTHDLKVRVNVLRNMQMRKGKNGRFAPAGDGEFEVV